MNVSRKQVKLLPAACLVFLGLAPAWADAPKKPPAVSFFPTILDFEQIPSSERPTQLLRVTFDRRVFPPDHLPTLRCEYGNNEAEVTLFSCVDGPRTITETYRVKFVGAYTPGFFRFFLTLHRDPVVSREDDATVAVEDNGVIVRGEVVQGLDTDSDRISFGRVELGRGATKEYRMGVFRSNFVSPQELNSRKRRPNLGNMTVTSSSSYVTAPSSDEMGLNGSMFETWHIVLSPKTPADFAGAELTFQTKNGYFLTVPVTAQIESQSLPEPEPPAKH